MSALSPYEKFKEQVVGKVDAARWGALASAVAIIAGAVCEVNRGRLDVLPLMFMLLAIPAFFWFFVDPFCRDWDREREELDAVDNITDPEERLRAMHRIGQTYHGL